MRRLLEDFDRLFDLRHEIDGVPLRRRIEDAIEGMSSDALPDWGTTGEVERLAEETIDAVRFRYVPHLFPGMDLKLRLAHLLQFQLLPRDPPPHSPMTVSAVLESYCHMSGDLFGWEVLADGRFLLWIVDMSGHGVRSGLTSAILRVIVSNLRDRGRLDSFVARLNEALCACKRRDSTPVFATGIFLVVSADGSVQYTSAGHPPALVRGRSGAVRRWSSNSRPIGMFPGTDYAVETTRLERDELVLLATDGLFELTDSHGDPLGVDRLEAFLASGSFDRTTELTDGLYRLCGDYRDLARLEDDLSFVGARLR